VLQQGKGGSVGLQILKDNKWMPIQPVPNAFVINIGDTLEVRKSWAFLSPSYHESML
jgi:isopenicillin N synthase-like dioxygenase